MAQYNGHCLNIHVQQFPPMSFYIRGPQGELVPVGVYVKIFRMLMEHFGFCYNMIATPMPGNLLSNGTWTGLFGYFQDGSADFAASPFFWNTDRASVTDYIPVTVSAHTFIYQAPKVKPDFLGFIKPYSAWSWVAILMVTVATMAALAITRARMEQQSSQAKMSRGVSICVRSLLGQDLPRQNSLLDRLLVGTLMFSCFIIGTVYKSNLSAMLILPRIVRPFDSLEELVESKVPFYLNRGTLVEFTAQSAPPNSALGKSARRAKGSFTVQDVEIIQEQISRGEYALSMPDVCGHFTVHSFFSRERWCPFMLMKHSFLTSVAAIPMKKKSPLNDRFKTAITGLIEFGIMDQSTRASIPHYETCMRSQRTQNTSLRALQIEDFIGVFFLYSVGVSLGIIGFIVELLFKTWVMKKAAGLLRIHLLPTTP